jgi:hypothetical protein
MTYDQLIEHYGSQIAASKALTALGMEISQPSISDWKRNGIPYLRQLEIEHVTDRALVADIPPFKATAERETA